ncbi:MAG: histidinol dehydrogenase [Desulfovibrionaceae bacterium]
MPCRDIMYASPADWPALGRWLAGRENPDQAVEDRVKAIIAAVAEEGDAALARYTATFDCPGFTPDMLAVPVADIRAAAAAVPAADMAILREAAHNIRVFHEAQVQQSWWTTREDGTVLGQIVRPVDRVGLYVPGGQGGETPLISSLLMNAIPAQVAGVRSIALVSPPRKDGTLNPYILAAADLLGITEIYRAGSAWSVAALAVGTQSIAPVDVIAGPGNIYVATAKRLLSGKVGIDMIAGPSEIAIVADGSVPAACLAADMLSQAEHDPQASSILITTDPAVATGVRAALLEQLEHLPRNDIARRALADWGGVAVVADLATAIELVNRLAPEHLELALADPWSALGSIRNAGAIFMGANAPEPVGDYFAGPNHVLPTMGTARFSSALSVETFCKKSSVVATSPAFLAAHGAKIARLARLEGLEAHARSVESRGLDT